jgi:hypothetical protein
MITYENWGGSTIQAYMNASMLDRRDVNHNISMSIVVGPHPFWKSERRFRSSGKSEILPGITTSHAFSKICC